MKESWAMKEPWWTAGLIALGLSVGALFGELIEQEEPTITISAPLEAPTLDPKSALALARIFPRGEGTPWCFIEASCDQYNQFMHSIRVYGGNEQRTCLDLIPCAEIPEVHCSITGYGLRECRRGRHVVEER